MKKSRWKRKIQPTTDVIRDRFLEIEGATLNHAHKFIIRRWKNLREVRRFAFAWLLFIAVLIGGAAWQTLDTQKLYTVQGSSEESTYTEGVFGAADNLSPIFASTAAERSASRLIFGTLLTYNDRNQLVGDLAESWSADETGKVYTVTLRKNLRWHDGKPLTAKDVFYTFAMIKNADTKSPLYSSWRNVAITQVDERTVTFTLPVSYAPFPNALTLGILPEHVLGKVPPAELRNNGYNRSPSVGSGPFVFKDIRGVNNGQSHVLIQLAANVDYYKGAPKLTRFNLHAFKERDELSRAYQSREVSALSDATTQDVQQLFSKDRDIRVDAPLHNGVYAFFKQGNPALQDLRVRMALQLGTNQAEIIKKLDSRVQPLNGPLLKGQLGYQENLKQAPYNIERAQQLLDEAGWLRNAQGKRIKEGQPLQFSMVSVSFGDYPAVAEELIKGWDKLGVTFQAQLVKPDDFQQTIILPHAYDVLLYELAIGRDPDVYAYWHSSQASERGLNLSEYKSPKVDDALDTARTRLDPALREAKYRTFVQQWLADVPAVALYQPSLTYLSNKNITNFNDHSLVEQADRYSNVLYWSAAKETLRTTR